MTIDKEIWEKLKDPEYRKLFVEEFAKRAFATQVRTIRKRRDWSQATLAQNAGVNQGVISRTEDPNLGTTFDTAAQVVSGFDLAFIPKVVTFSEFVRWVEEVSKGFTDLPTFKEEKDDIDIVEQLKNQGIESQSGKAKAPYDLAGNATAEASPLSDVLGGAKRRPTGQQADNKAALMGGTAAA